MLKTQTKKIKNRKVSKIIAGILSFLMFATSNGSFLVWGLSEGQLNFLGEPAVAQAKTAEAKVIETADAITVDEITQEGQPKRHWWTKFAGLFSKNLKTDILAGIGKNNEQNKKPVKVFVLDSGYSHSKCVQQIGKDCAKIAGFYDVSTGKIKKILPNSQGYYEDDQNGHGSEMVSAYNTVIKPLIDKGNIEIYMVKMSDKQGKTDIKTALPRALDLAEQEGADVVGISSYESTVYSKHTTEDLNARINLKNKIHQLRNKGILISTIAGNDGYGAYYNGKSYINTLVDPGDTLVVGALDSQKNNQTPAFYTSGINTGSIDAFASELFSDPQHSEYGGTSTAGAIAGAEMATWKKLYADDLNRDGVIDVDDYKIYKTSPQNALNLTIPTKVMTYKALAEDGYEYDKDKNIFIAPGKKEKFTPLEFNIVEDPEKIKDKFLHAKFTVTKDTPLQRDMYKKVGLKPFLEKHNVATGKKAYDTSQFGDNSSYVYAIGHRITDTGYHWNDKYKAWVLKDENMVSAIRLDDVKKYATGDYGTDIDNLLIIRANNIDELENKLKDKTIDYHKNIFLTKHPYYSNNNRIYNIINSKKSISGYVKIMQLGRSIIYNKQGASVGDLVDNKNGTFNIEYGNNQHDIVKADSLEEALDKVGLNDNKTPQDIVDKQSFSWVKPWTWFNKKNNKKTTEQINALDSFYTAGSENGENKNNDTAYNKAVAKYGQGDMNGYTNKELADLDKQMNGNNLVGEDKNNNNNPPYDDLAKTRLAVFSQKNKGEINYGEIVGGLIDIKKREIQSDDNFRRKLREYNNNEKLAREAIENEFRNLEKAEIEVVNNKSLKDRLYNIVVGNGEDVTGYTQPKTILDWAKGIVGLKYNSKLVLHSEKNDLNDFVLLAFHEIDHLTRSGEKSGSGDFQKLVRKSVVNEKEFEKYNGRLYSDPNKTYTYLTGLSAINAHDTDEFSNEDNASNQDQYESVGGNPGEELRVRLDVFNRDLERMGIKTFGEDLTSDHLKMLMERDPTGVYDLYLTEKDPHKKLNLLASALSANGAVFSVNSRELFSVAKDEKSLIDLVNYDVHNTLNNGSNSVRSSRELSSLEGRLGMGVDTVNDNNGRGLLNTTNTPQQSAKLKAIEEKKGWLASGWDKFTSWFGGNKDKQSTEQEAKDYFGTEGETIAGLGGDKNNDTAYNDLAKKYIQPDMESGYGDEITGVKEQMDKNNSFVTDVNGNKISFANEPREMIDADYTFADKTKMKLIQENEHGQKLNSSVINEKTGLTGDVSGYDEASNGLPIDNSNYQNKNEDSNKDDEIFSINLTDKENYRYAILNEHIMDLSPEERVELNRLREKGDGVVRPAVDPVDLAVIVATGGLSVGAEKGGASLLKNILHPQTFVQKWIGGLTEQYAENGLAKTGWEVTKKGYGLYDKGYSIMGTREGVKEVLGGENADSSVVSATTFFLHKTGLDHLLHISGILGAGHFLGTLEGNGGIVNRDSLFEKETWHGGEEVGIGAKAIMHYLPVPAWTKKIPDHLKLIARAGKLFGKEGEGHGEGGHGEGSEHNKESGHGESNVGHVAKNEENNERGTEKKDLTDNLLARQSPQNDQLNTTNNLGDGDVDVRENELLKDTAPKAWQEGIVSANQDLENMMNNNELFGFNSENKESGMNHNIETLSDSNNSNKYVNPITGEVVENPGNIILQQEQTRQEQEKNKGFFARIFSPNNSIAGDGKPGEVQEGINVVTGEKQYYITDKDGETVSLMPYNEYAKYTKEESDNARGEARANLTNPAQQSAKLKAIEEKNGWLASGWEEFTSWFGGNKDKQITEQEADDYFGTGGETIAGLGENDKGNSSYDDLVAKYGKDDMKDGYGDEIAGVKEQVDKNNSFVTDANGDKILGAANNDSGFWGSLLKNANTSYKKIIASPIGKVAINYIPGIREVKQVADGLSAGSTIYSQYTAKAKPKPTVIIKARNATEAMGRIFPVDSKITQQGSDTSIVRDSKGNPIGSIRKDDVNKYKIVKFGDKNFSSSSVNQGSGERKILSTGFKTTEAASIALEKQHPALKNSTKRVNPNNGATVYYDKNNKPIFSIKKVGGNVVIKDFNQDNNNKKGNTNNQNSLLNILGMLPVIGEPLKIASSFLEMAQQAPETADRISKGEVETKDIELGIGALRLLGISVSAPASLAVMVANVGYTKWKALSPTEKEKIARELESSVDDVERAFEDAADQVSNVVDEAGKTIKGIGDDAIAMMPSGEAGKFTYLGDGKYFYSSNPNDKKIYKRTEDGRFKEADLVGNPKELELTKAEIIKSAKEDAWGSSGPSQYFINSSDSKLYTEIYQSEHKKFQNVNDELEKAMSQDSNLFGFNNKWTNPDTEVALNSTKQRQDVQKNTKDEVVKNVKHYEGYKDKLYRDPNGHWSAGYGKFVASKSATREEAEIKLKKMGYNDNWTQEEKKTFFTHLMEGDVNESLRDAEKIATEYGIKLNDKQKRAVADMVYNMGPEKVRAFKRMWEALKNGNVKKAGDEIEFKNADVCKEKKPECFTAYRNDTGERRAGINADMMRNSGKVVTTKKSSWWETFKSWFDRNKDKQVTDEDVANFDSGAGGIITGLNGDESNNNVVSSTTTKNRDGQQPLISGSDKWNEGMSVGEPDYSSSQGGNRTQGNVLSKRDDNVSRSTETSNELPKEEENFWSKINPFKLLFGREEKTAYDQVGEEFGSQYKVGTDSADRVVSDNVDELSQNGAGNSDKSPDVYKFVTSSEAPFSESEYFRIIGRAIEDNKHEADFNGKTYKVVADNKKDGKTVVVNKETGQKYYYDEEGFMYSLNPEEARAKNYRPFSTDAPKGENIFSPDGVLSTIREEDKKNSEENGGTWDKSKEDLSDSWVGGLFDTDNQDTTRRNNYVENGQIDSNTKNLPVEYLSNNSNGGDNYTDDVVSAGSRPYGKIKVSNNEDYSGDDWGEDLGDTVNDRQTTGNGGVLDNDTQETQFFDADGNLLYVNSSGESDVLQSAGNGDTKNNPVNAPPAGNDFGFNQFVEKGLLPGLANGGQRGILAMAGGADNDEVLGIIVQDVIGSSMDGAVDAVFGEDKNGDGIKEAGWLAHSMGNAAAGVITALTVGDKGDAIEAASNLVFEAGVNALADNGIIKPEDVNTIKGAATSYLGQGMIDMAKDLTNGVDFDRALEHGLTTVAVGYINKVVIPEHANLWGGSSKATGLTGAGLTAGVSSLGRQLLNGEVDVKELGEDVIQGVATQYAIDAIGDFASASAQASLEAAADAMGEVVSDATLATAGAQAMAEAIGNYGWVIKAGISVARLLIDGKLDMKSIATTAISIAATEIAISSGLALSIATTLGVAGSTAAAGASAGSVVPGIGTAIGAVVGLIAGMLMGGSGPKDYEIADWKASAGEAINPSLIVKGLNPTVSQAIAQVAQSGDVDKAKQMMRQVLESTALGRLAIMSGLSGLLDSAVALMNNRITRLRNDFKPGELEGYTGDNIHTGDASLDEATNKYMHLKNKLKDCYLRKDQDCVGDVSQEIRGVRNGLIALATTKFNDEIAELNKEIHDLENQRAQAKTAKERAELQAKLRERTNRRDILRSARDQYNEVARSCPPGKEWHVVDHYCIDISKNKAHCEGGGGTWHGSLITGTTGCTCDKKPGGHWMGNHCEYGFNKEQQHQLDLRGAADECSHRIGHWRWDGHNCVEVSSKPPKRPKPSVNQATRFGGGDDDSEGE